MPPHVRGILLAAGGALLFSFDGLLIRAQSLSPVGIMFWRSVFACAAYGAIGLVAARGKAPKADARRRGWAPMLVIAALILVSNSTFVFSITHTSIAQTLLIVASVPIVTGILGYFALHERLPLRTWLAGAACLAGVLVVVSGSVGSFGLQGDLWAVASVAAQAMLFVEFRRRPELSRPQALVLAAISATVIFAPFARPFPDATTAIAAAIGGLLIVPGGWLLTTIAPRYVAAAVVALFLLIETILGPVWAFAVFGELPTLAVVLSAVVIVGAIAVHSWFDLRGPVPGSKDRVLVDEQGGSEKRTL